MADLALLRSRRPELRALAERIRTSQSRENAQMRRWYRQWYGDVGDVLLLPEGHHCIAVFLDHCRGCGEQIIGRDA